MFLNNVLTENDIKIFKESISISELCENNTRFNFGPDSDINSKIGSSDYTKEDIENEYPGKFILANDKYEEMTDILKKCIKNFISFEFIDLFNEGIVYKYNDSKKLKSLRVRIGFISFEKLLNLKIEQNNISYWSESKIGNYTVDGSIKFTGKDKYLDTIMHEFDENIKFVGVRSGNKSIELIFRGKAFISLCFNNTVVVKEFNENDHNIEEFALNEKASDEIMKHIHDNFTLREIAKQDILVQDFIAKKFYELNLSFEKNK